MYKSRLLPCIPEGLTGIAYRKKTKPKPVLVGKKESEELSQPTVFLVPVGVNTQGSKQREERNNGGKDISLCLLDSSVFSRWMFPTSLPLERGEEFYDMLWSDNKNKTKVTLSK